LQELEKEMVIEPTEFNIFGIEVKQQSLFNIRQALSVTYDRLMEENRKWEDTEFCKREIASLWEGIMEMLRRLSKLPVSEGMRQDKQIRQLLITDVDNMQFLRLFGEVLEKSGAMKDILAQLKEIEISSGSLRVFFRKSVSNQMAEVKIDASKMLNRIQRESNKIKNGLMHFVDWAKENKQTIMTCSLVAGVVVTSLAAICYIGVPMLGLKLLIMASLAIICLIYEAYGAFSTIEEVSKALLRRFGISM
jgi:hypothetical protein